MLPQHSNVLSLSLGDADDHRNKTKREVDREDVSVHLIAYYRLRAPTRV